jgi:hypothetical protein
MPLSLLLLINSYLFNEWIIIISKLLLILFSLFNCERNKYRYEESFSSYLMPLSSIIKDWYLWLEIVQWQYIRKIGLYLRILLLCFVSCIKPTHYWVIIVWLSNNSVKLEFDFVLFIVYYKRIGIGWLKRTSLSSIKFA